MDGVVRPNRLFTDMFVTSDTGYIPRAAGGGNTDPARHLPVFEFPMFLCSAWRVVFISMGDNNNE